MKKLDVNGCGFAHLTLLVLLLLHYIVKYRSRSLAVYNNKFILGSHASAQLLFQDGVDCRPQTVD